MNDEAISRRRLRKNIAAGAMVVFVAVGFFLFSGRMPKDVTLRFEVPRMLHAGGGVAGDFPREGLVQLSGQLSDSEGRKVASVSVPTPEGVVGPLSPPVGLQLRNGKYLVHVSASTGDGRSAELVGSFEVDGSGEVRADLRPPR